LPEGKSVEMALDTSRAPKIQFPEPIQHDLGRSVRSQKYSASPRPKLKSSSISEFQKFA
jgi:hypothetical protein